MDYQDELFELHHRIRDLVAKYAREGRYDTVDDLNALLGDEPESTHPLDADDAPKGWADNE